MVFCLKKGFKRGDIKEVSEAPVPKEVVLPKQEPEAPKPVSSTMRLNEESVIPLKTMAEEPLALIVF